VLGAIALLSTERRIALESPTEAKPTSPF